MISKNDITIGARVIITDDKNRKYGKYSDVLGIPGKIVGLYTDNRKDKSIKEVRFDNNILKQDVSYRVLRIFTFNEEIANVKTFYNFCEKEICRMKKTDS